MTGSGCQIAVACTECRCSSLTVYASRPADCCSQSTGEMSLAVIWSGCCFDLARGFPRRTSDVGSQLWTTVSRLFRDVLGQPVMVCHCPRRDFCSPTVKVLVWSTSSILEAAQRANPWQTGHRWVVVGWYQWHLARDSPCLCCDGDCSLLPPVPAASDFCQTLASEADRYWRPI